MEKYSLKDMTKGWFIGPFTPTLHSTDQFEVAVKRYSRGDFENKHLHKISTEYTVILNGEVKMNGIIYKDGDIIKILPNDSTDFECLSDSVTTVVVKTPASLGDKYEC